MRIVNGSTFIGSKLQRGVSIAFETDSVTALGANLPDSETYDATGCYVVPGFIDTHIHGFAGGGVMEGGEQPSGTWRAVWPRTASRRFCPR